MTEFDIPPVVLAQAAPPAADEPAGFDDFWSEFLVRLRGAEAARLDPARFTGRGVTADGVALGDLRGWFVTPSDVSGSVPALVQLVPRGGRGKVRDHSWTVPAGIAHLVIELPRDADPADPFNREASADAVRAVVEARALPGVDPSRVAVLGRTGAGPAAVAAAGLLQDVACVVAEAPFPAASATATRAFARRSASPLLLVPGDGAQEVFDDWGAHSSRMIQELSGRTAPDDVVERVIDHSEPSARHRAYLAWFDRHTALTRVFEPRVPS